MIDTFDEPMADDETPVLAELPRLPHVEMPEGRVHVRYLALAQEVARDLVHEETSGTRFGPRRGVRLRWKIAVPAIALGAAGLAALSLAVVGSDSAPAGQGDGALIASWTPIPTPLTAAQRHDALQQCTNGPIQPSRVVLAEQRGKATVLLLVSGPDYVTCILGATEDTQRPSYVVWPASAANQDFGTRVMAFPGDTPGDFAVGTVAPDVAKATVTLTDGQVVTAMVDDGWAFVWWPDKAAAKTLTEYTTDGSIVSTSNTR
jgi:hypothetical protein